MQASAKYVKFTLVFLLVHFTSFYFKILPLGLMYGPLIYAIAYGIPIRTFICHLIFPILYIIYSFLYSYGIVGWNNWFSLSFISLYLLLVSISMTTYYMVICFKKEHIQNSVIKKELLHLLRFFYSLGCVFTIVLFFNSSGLIAPLGFNPSYLINLLIGSTFFIVLYYLIERDKEIKKFNMAFPTSYESSKIMEEYEKSLQLYFDESKLFLEPGISLESLSNETNIPKHHLSRLFNLHMGKSFYQVVSEYRIKYAEERLKEDHYITIESLSYECGFNSKSTFNKYFKEYTGYAPSEYRLFFLNLS